MEKIDLTHCQGFDWDHGNQHKSWIKHGVTQGECEQIFFNNPLLLHDDLKHSALESRHYALGKTDQNRKLYVVFTIRKNLIRVISAREMNKKERGHYENV